jgi:hypothetical protein
LVLAIEQFEVFLTVDRNHAFQQRIVDLSIAVIVLRARSNRLADLKPLASRLLAALGEAKPGCVVFVGD